MLRFIPALLALSLTLTTNFAFASESENLFQKGLAAYQNKQYGEARDHFQKLIEQNHVSPAVLHNLALTYMQLDQAPMSVALWRKALMLEPGFRPARAGREYAEGLLHTRGFERDQFSASLQRNLEVISLYESLWLIALLLAAAGGLWIRYAADRRQALDEEAPLPPFPVTAAILSVLLLGAFLLATLKISGAQKVRATIVVKKTNARSLPNEEGVGLFELNGGSEVLIRKREKDWSQVQNSEGASGWIANGEIFITSK